ncbi:sialidase family protein [Novipirellula caenicola]|uniref:BNR/Asp-box repeat protein n=1 Tax=Novipirellula caenicola TaxID=1536901 RepID=A0ABP9VXY2_9BACT
MNRVLPILAFALFPIVVNAADNAIATNDSRSNPSENQGELVLVDVQRIWNAAPHNAFTDLVRFKDRWYCVFREGSAHVSPDGALRVLTSDEGVHWESAALVTSDDSDLRDAKITVTPDNRLMLAGAEAIETPNGRHHQSLVWFSDDGRTWSEKQKIGTFDNWLWRISWHDSKAYGFGYGTGANQGQLSFYRSDDGKDFDALIKQVDAGGTYPNESSLIFLPDDTAYCLLRQDGTPNTGLLGTSQPPYTEWDWQSLDRRIGGPDMMQLPDGRIIACVRLYDNKVRTSLCWLDPTTAKLTEAIALPSGGDTSYAGMVWHDDHLWVSYYSSHEGKTSIYLAKLR